MSPGSSPEPDRFFTVQDARKIVEYFSPEMAISDDKIRRYCREGKIAGEQVDKRWVLTLGALFQAGLIPLEALDHYGEALEIPDSVPEDWVKPLEPHEPGPLERMLAADAAAQAAANAVHESETEATPDDKLDVELTGVAPSAEEGGRGDESESVLSDAWNDEGDADLAPASLSSQGAGRSARDSAPAPASPPTAPTGARRRRRVLVLVVPAALALGAVGAIATSGDQSSPAQAQPSAATVDVAAEQRLREEQVALRTTMTVAARHGDYRTAITSATDLRDTQAADEYRRAAASTLVNRARAAAERGDLDRARGLVHRARRYASIRGIDQVDRRVDEIENARSARAAKRRSVAAKRAAARRAAAAAAARSVATPSPSATPAPATRQPTPAPTSPKPAPSPGGGSGGSGGSAGGSGGSSDKPVDPGIF